MKWGSISANFVWQVIICDPFANVTGVCESSENHTGVIYPIEMHSLETTALWEQRQRGSSHVLAGTLQ